MAALSAREIHGLFALLSDELGAVGVKGEIYLTGGAVMCLVHAARASTADVDAFFRPSRAVRDAAARVAAKRKLAANWLNDAVKGYLSERGDFEPFLEFEHLQVLSAQPEYLLAMKCLAYRIGVEFHDEDDIRFLLRLLDVQSYAEAIEIITRYYPLERFPQKTLYALQELLPGG